MNDQQAKALADSDKRAIQIMRLATELAEENRDLRSRTPSAPDVAMEGPQFSFDRYINGVKMAEGVTIERQQTFEDAARAAARIAGRGKYGEPAVLVYRPPASEAKSGESAPTSELDRSKLLFAILQFTLNEMQHTGSWHQPTLDRVAELASQISSTESNTLELRDLVAMFPAQEGE